LNKFDSTAKVHWQARHWARAINVTWTIPPAHNIAISTYEMNSAQRAVANTRQI